jgi:GGDEF domain-containing protein
MRVASYAKADCADFGEINPIKGEWFGDIYLCPTTGLVSFQSFYRKFPEVLPMLLRADQGFGLAIGDVDNLKSYVESSKREHPEKFGHIAGNQFMGMLSRISATHFHGMNHSWSCLSSFGGDEIILAATGIERRQFLQDIKMLCRDIDCSLPRSVSFAIGWFCGDSSRGDQLDQVALKQLSTASLSMVDRALLEAKSRRRRLLGDGQKNKVSPFVVSMKTRHLSNNDWVISV